MDMEIEEEKLCLIIRIKVKVTVKYIYVKINITANNIVNFFFFFFLMFDNSLNYFDLVIELRKSKKSTHVYEKLEAQFVVIRQKFLHQFYFQLREESCKYLL